MRCTFTPASPQGAASRMLPPSSPLLLQPWMPVAAFIASVLGALALYDIEVALSTWMVVLAFLTTLVLAWGVIGGLVCRSRLTLPVGDTFRFRRLVTLLIVCASLIEYTIFGVPVFGDLIYVDFGLPWLHHLSVTSWLLVFTARAFDSRPLRHCTWAFALLNPILMLNRDALLLTLFSFLAASMLSGRLRGWHIAGAFGAAGAVFGLVGDLRSPLALQVIGLPLFFDATELPSVLVWPLVYVTSSAFNMLYNFDSLRLELYSDFINVFPEAFNWAVRSNTYVAIPVFYGVIVSLLLTLHRWASTRPALVPLYVYFLYQAYMSLFAVKFFTTNSLFVCSLLFAMAFHLPAVARRARVSAA